jgi:hypothetical protein
MNQKSKKQSRNRCGWDTLNVNVLLGNNALADFKADAKKHRMKWSNYVSSALRYFRQNHRLEDLEKLAEMRQSALGVLLVGQDAFLEDELLNIAGRWSAAKRLKTSEKMARWVSQLRDSVNFAESRTN